MLQESRGVKGGMFRSLQGKCSVGLCFCLSGLVKNTSLRAPKGAQEAEEVEVHRNEPQAHEK